MTDGMLEVKEEMIKAAVSVVMEPVLELLQADPHLWSKRPCSTCQAISTLVGKPFGCVLKAKKG